MIASFIPWSGVVNSAPLILTTNGLTYRRWSCLLANLNSFAYDFIARQKVGGLHLNFFIVEQLPTLPPDRYEEKCPWDKKATLEKWISERVLKLTCTADDMRPLAEAAGFKEGVHKWDEAERANSAPNWTPRTSTSTAWTAMKWTTSGPVPGRGQGGRGPRPARPDAAGDPGGLRRLTESVEG